MSSRHSTVGLCTFLFEVPLDSMNTAFFFFLLIYNLTCARRQKMYLTKTYITLIPRGVSSTVREWNK